MVCVFLFFSLSNHFVYLSVFRISIITYCQVRYSWQVLPAACDAAIVAGSCQRNEEYMLTNDFYFDLPKELIAQHPSGERGNDRLMVLDRASGRITDAVFSDLPAFLPSDCLMVFNNTKVRHARVYAQSGASEVEFLLVAPIDTGHTWKVLIKRSKRQKEGKHYTFADGDCASCYGSLR